MFALPELKATLAGIPARRTPQRPDLFSISGPAHYEDILSNWYRYLFDPAEDHGLGHAFLQAVYDLAGRTMPFQQNVQVEREWSTPEGKAIDLVIHDGGRAGRKVMANHVLIIENKVHHWLANDLGIYWNVGMNAESDRLGVVLSLHPLRIGHPHFNNITHRQLLNAVCRRPSGVMPARTRVYLDDLRNNIDRLTQHMAYSDRIAFYLDHAPQINEAMALRADVRQYLTTELGAVAERLGGMKLQNWADKYWYIYRHDADKVYYTVLLDDMLDRGDALHVVIELNGIDERRLDELDRHCAHHLGGALLTERPFRKGKDWIQYTGIRVPIAPDERSRLAEVVTDAIERDLKELFHAIDTWAKA